MENKNLLLSVGMPAYNSELYIRDAIESILNQTFTDFELIISDNASSDSTQSICEEYAAKDSRIRYIRNKVNIGVAGNYNAVFKLSKGKYFKWASSNDYCDPRFFEQCINTMELNPDAVLAFPRTRLFSNNIDYYMDYSDSLATSSDSAKERMLHIIDNIRLNNIMNGLIRSDVLSKTYLQLTFFASDSCLMCELALYGKFIEVPEYLFYRRMDEESSLTLQDEMALVEHFQPNSKKPMRFQNWKIHMYYFAATSKAGLKFSESLLIYIELIHRMYWHKDRLLRDFLFWKPFRTSSIVNWEDL
jgi:glycosyltransferase involved in cell wall biosynthesis